MTDCDNELEFLVADEITGEFAVEDVHMDVVIIVAIDEKLVACVSIFSKTGFFITATSTLVAREDAETDTVKIKIFETVLEN